MLAQTELSAEEKMRAVMDNPKWKSYVDEHLRYVEFEASEEANESIQQLIDWYVDKKSKRVKYSGVKLKKMFLSLPEVEQRQVGLALLTGSESDTEWTCHQLLPNKPMFQENWTVRWHPCYTEAVEACWNRFQGQYCGQLMIQFLDEEAVRRHLQELETQKLYFRLCRRFANAGWFVMDVEKLKRCTYINSYLSVMSLLPQGISPEEARALLFQWTGVATVHHMQRFFTDGNIFWNAKTCDHRVLNAWGFTTALYYMLKMNLHEVVSDFLDWEEEVVNDYRETVKTDEDTPELEDRFRQTILDHFPDDMRHFTKLDFQHYYYVSTPGKILTVPEFHSIYEYDSPVDFPPFGILVPGHGMVGDFYSAVGAASPLEQMSHDNPSVAKFVEELDLVEDFLPEEGDSKVSLYGNSDVLPF